MISQPVLSRTRLLGLSLGMAALVLLTAVVLPRTYEAKLDSSLAETRRALLATGSALPQAEQSGEIGSPAWQRRLREAAGPRHFIYQPEEFGSIDHRAIYAVGVFHFKLLAIGPRGEVLRYLDGKVVQLPGQAQRHPNGWIWHQP